MAWSAEPPSQSYDGPSIDIASNRGGEYAAYKDFRSLRRSQNRLHKQSAKYYGFRGVDPKWIGQPYDPVWRSSMTRWKNSLPTSKPDIKYPVYTKRDMWIDREFNIWPLDRRHHVGKRIREKRVWKYQDRALQRRTKSRARMMDFASDDMSYQDVDSVYDFSDECEYMIPIYEGSEDGMWNIPECFPPDDTTQQDPDIPDCDPIDGFVLLCDSLWIGDKGEDYLVIESQNFDVISISSASSAWGIGRHG